MKAIILAGGLGSRLRPFTEVIPKPLLPIGEKALMEIQIEKLAHCGFNTVYVASNYKSDYVEAFLGDGKKYGVKIIYSKEDKPLGTAGPATLLKNELKEGFILMNGDILTKLDFKELYEFGEKQSSILTIGTKIISTPFRFGNVFSDENNFVTGIEEKPNFQLEILAGIYYMKPEIFDVIPEDTYYGMDILIKDMLAKDLKISKFLIKDYWLDIGQIEDYSKANEIYKEHFHTAKS
jgi:NDP-sugar pyrophosphorylase family protein